MQIDSDFEFQIKLMIIGDSGVGKTNFIFQFTEGRFSTLHVSTAGFDYKTKIIKLPKSKKYVKLQIWDTCGQERYMAVNKSLFQKVQGIIIMYDLTNRDSFNNLNVWTNLVTQAASNKTIMLVGNKLDLSEHERIVSESEGEKYAKDNHFLFCEGSGCTGKNVDEIFITIAEKIYNRLMDGMSDNLSGNQNLNKKFSNENKKCC